MTFDEELVATAHRLLARRAGQRGRISSARVRRAISTAYYALFHLLVEDSTRSIVGADNGLRRRRRTLGRLFTHAGMKAALARIRSAKVEEGVEDMLRPPSAAAGPVASPQFGREMAAAFLDAQAKRHDADYDLNKNLSALDAELVLRRVETATAAWRGANSRTDRDFKHALALLMLLKGKLRAEG